MTTGPEGTGAAVRVVETATVVLAGLLSATAGALVFPDRSWFVAALLLVLITGLFSLLLSAVGRGLGAAHGEAVALALAMPARALRVGLRPLGRLVAAISGGQARFTLPRPPLANRCCSMTSSMARAELRPIHESGALSTATPRPMAGATTSCSTTPTPPTTLPWTGTDT